MIGSRGYGYGGHSLITMPKETKFVNLVEHRFDSEEKTESIEDPIVDYVLRCIKGIFVGRFIFINLTEEGETFGSEAEGDLTMYIENSGLSPKHAEIKYEGKKYYLKDLNSERGTRFFFVKKTLFQFMKIFKSKLEMISMPSDSLNKILKMI